MEGWWFSRIFPCFADTALQCLVLSVLNFSRASSVVYSVFLLIYLSFSDCGCSPFSFCYNFFLSFALPGSRNSLQMPWLTPCPSCVPTASKNFLWKEHWNRAQETLALILPLLLLWDIGQSCFFSGLLTGGWRVWVTQFPGSISAPRCRVGSSCEAGAGWGGNKDGLLMLV